MNYSISKTYDLVWQIKGAENYKFTKDGLCFNTRTGKQIKQVLNGRSIGYCIKGKFESAKTLRTKLERIPKINCPF